MAQEGGVRAEGRAAKTARTGALSGAKGRARLERAMMGYVLERLGDEGRPAGQAVTATEIQLALALLGRAGDDPRAATGAGRVASMSDTDALIRRKLDALSGAA